MNDIQTTPKKLWQVNWGLGQTDGELGENTVRKLWNVEIDKYGELRPREQLSSTAVHDETDTLDVAYMSADPSGINAGGWDFYLTVDSVRVHRAGNASAYTTLSLGELAGADSHLEVYGGLVFVVIGEGSPGSLKVIYNSGDSDRFRPPEEWTPSGDALFGSDSEQSVSGLWRIEDVSRAAPEAGFFVASKDPGYDTILNNAIAFTNDTGYANRVAVIYKVIEADPGSGLPAYSDSADVEIAVGFRYADGHISEMSESTKFVINDGEGLAYTVGVSSTGFRNDVSHINVYRRTGYEDADADWDLINAIPVYSDGLDGYDSTGAGDITEGWVEGDQLDGYALADMGAGYTDIRGKIQFYENSQANPGSALRTAGWRRIDDGSDFMHIFHADHFIGEGQLEVTFERESDPDNYYFKFQVPSVIFACGVMSEQRISYIFNGEHLPIPLVPYSGTPDWIQIKKDGSSNGTINYMPRDGFYGIIEASGTYTGEAKYGANSGSSISWGAGSAPGQLDRDTCLAMYVDVGTPALTTYETIRGVTREEEVSVTPMHIDFVGGRMVMLDVEDADGSRDKFKLMWSQVGQFAAVGGTNYIEYGHGGGGAGVGLATHGSRLLILGQSAVHALDVSGGSDMSWRGVGSWKDVGCLHRLAYCETPAGVVFADQDKAFLWNGQGLKELTSDPTRGIYVRDTYKTYAASLDAVVYRPTMRQVWFCSGKKVLVLDLDRMAWHEHQLGEIDDNREVFKIDMVETNDRVFIRSTTSQHLYAYEFDDTLDYMDWGLYSGPITIGTAEIVKKLKRVYVETAVDGADPGAPDPYGDFTVAVNGDTPVDKVRPGPGTHRISKSARGYAIEIDVLVKKEKPWRGTIKSVAMSYKLKRLK